MSAIARSIFNGRMLAILSLGISSGLPLLLIGSTLKAWMKLEGVDLTVIGLAGLVGLPYSLKFLWAPLMDRFPLPFLGRRRGWIFVTQIAIAVCLVGLAFSNPSTQLWQVVGLSMLCAFLSASQDIVIDAYRRELLAISELGLGSAMGTNGYRLGLYAAGAGALFLAADFSWPTSYLVMAGLMASFTLITLLSPEPKSQPTPPKTFEEAIAKPFVDFFRRRGAVEILIFILLYKVGDSMASDMFTPFYLDMQFSLKEIAVVAKTMGVWATILGATIGGILMLKLPMMRALWIFGILQAVSTASFAALAYSGYSIWLLSAVIAFENITGGMGATAYTAFMAALCNTRFTATQYALLSSLASVPRIFMGGSSGYIAKHLGWTWYFLFCTAIALPGMLMLLRANKWQQVAD